VSTEELSIHQAQKIFMNYATYSAVALRMGHPINAAPIRKHLEKFLEHYFDYLDLLLEKVGAGETA
jgi:hypothetical protein